MTLDPRNPRIRRRDLEKAIRAGRQNSLFTAGSGFVSGGNISLPSAAGVQGIPFMCLVTKSGGVSGSETTECTWIYDIFMLDDNTGIADDLTPEIPRYHFMEYWYAGETRTLPNVATSRYALVAYDNDGELKLLVCFGEVEKDDPC